MGSASMTSPRVNPTEAQLQSLYIECYTLTNVMFQPIHVVRLDERTKNIFILAGREETLEFEIEPNGRLAEDEQI